MVRATIRGCFAIQRLQSAFFALFILGKPDGVVRGRNALSLSPGDFLAHRETTARSSPTLFGSGTPAGKILAGKSDARELLVRAGTDRDETTDRAKQLTHERQHRKKALQREPVNGGQESHGQCRLLRWDECE
jgi:hypothetical protein